MDSNLDRRRCACLSSGCGTVDSVVASNNIGHRFAFSHQHLLLNNYLLLTVVDKQIITFFFMAILKARALTIRPPSLPRSNEKHAILITKSFEFMEFMSKCELVEVNSYDLSKCCSKQRTPAQKSCQDKDV